jgi:acetylornithine deacetylase
MAAAFSRVEPESGAITLVLSPDEETYSEGLYDFLALRGDSGDMAVVGEPTGLDVCNAARGCFKYVVEIEGVPAHSGTADSGTDAVSAGARAITAIESMEQHSHDYLGSTDQTISWVEGGPVGELTAQVPDTIRFYLNRWSVPPETVSSYESKLRSTLSDVECSVTVRNPYMQNRLLEAYVVDADEPVIADLAAVSTRHRNGAAEVRPFGVAAESSLFSRYMPVAVFGPGHNTDDEGPIAHSDREHIAVDQVETATDIMTTFLEETV